MIVVRPIEQKDFDDLRAIANESGVGFTSLPENDDLLKRKINYAEQAFQSQPTEPGDQSYLFVLENTETQQVLGVSGLEASLGMEDPNYHYHLSKVVHASRELNVRNTVEVLTLCNDYTGVSELCTLFLRENARSGLNGRLLSKFRFLFMAEHPHRFSQRIIAEMRGVSSENGESPFWHWLQEHFFSMDFPKADYLTGIGQKVFIAELMPKYPIYVKLLSEEAQAVIGQVHEKTRPALKMLQAEGFSCRGYVDIFDAGPTVEANLEHVRTAQLSQKLQVKLGDPNDCEACFVINTHVKSFRAVAAKVRVQDSPNGDAFAIIEPDVAHALQVKEGEFVRFAPNIGSGSLTR